MGKYIYLIKVEGGENNNKYYEMNENSDGTFTASYGRVGNNPQIKIYPMSKWDSTYRSKTSARKGYKDVTEMMAVKSKETKFKDIDDSVISDIISYLLDASNKNVSDNYMVKADAVTQKQVDEAQVVLNKIANLIKTGNNTKDINENLQDLYSIIPRKMKKVSDYLLNVGILGKDVNIEDVRSFLTSEQDKLDSMASSVIVNSISSEMENVEEKTILDVLGVSIDRTSNDEDIMIKKMMGNTKGKFKRAIKITHHNSRKRFVNHIENSDNKKTDLLWHGSRNENWISIMQNGLMIRPSNAVYTGSMFGDSIYMADKAQKSLGYSSLRGSYWTKANSNKGFLALFECHTGNQMHIYKHGSWCYSLNEKYLKDKGNYDSCFCHGGVDLRNNEFTFYNSNQVTIKYLIELENGG